MNNASTIKLLNKAIKLTGSDTETARLLDMSPQNLSNIRHHGRSLTPAKIAMLAELVGEQWTEPTLAALAELSRAPRDREFWTRKLKESREDRRKGNCGKFLENGAGLLARR